MLKINGQLVTNVSLQGKNVVRILRDDEVLWEKDTIDYFYLENASQRKAKFVLTKYGTPASTDLQYKVDNGAWTDFDLTLDNNNVDVPAGSKIYLRSSSGFSKSSSSYFRINLKTSYTNDIMNAGGNIATLFRYKNIDTFNRIPDYGCYQMLLASNITNAEDIDFSGVSTCGKYSFTNAFATSHIKYAPDMPSLEIVEEGAFYNCFQNNKAVVKGIGMGSVKYVYNRGLYGMYDGCSKLTTVSDMDSLERITDYGCQYMYQNCTSLTVAPNMPSLTSISTSGCEQMFYGCTSLVTPCNMSNVTSISSRALYQMYRGCTALTEPSDLPNLADIPDSGIRATYNGCTALTRTADIGNVTRVGNQGLYFTYYGCTSLTEGCDMRNVTYTGTQACASMYQGCSNISTIYAPSITWLSSSFTDWVNGVAAVGDMYFDVIGGRIPVGTYGIPSGWQLHQPTEPVEPYVIWFSNMLDGITYKIDDGEFAALPETDYEVYDTITVDNDGTTLQTITFHDPTPNKSRVITYYDDTGYNKENFNDGDITLCLSNLSLGEAWPIDLFDMT